MGIYSFRGGVHPKGNKELTAGKAFVRLIPKGDMVYPLSQHLGKPASPLVKKNDPVLAGQLIAKADGFISANIHSSCSGKVKAIERRLNASGVPVDCIVIANDGQFTPAPGVGEEVDYSSFSKEEIIAKVKECGIVGLGGAGFPTNVKLMPKNPDEIRYIIANGAECEPGITCDDRLMREYTDWIIKGLKIVLSLFPAASGIIAIEDNKPESIRAMEEAVKNEERMSVLTLKTMYPQGGERNLVHAATGMYMESGALPASLGCIVDNVATLSAIYRAVAFNEPLMEKGFTATGDGFNEPTNFMVRIGTSLREITDAAGGLKEETRKLILGGPMMGPAVSNLDAPLVKANNALTAQLEDEVEKAELEMNSCIRCGRCTRVCPLGLIPQQMARACERNDIERFVKLHGADCIQCGTCSFICPAKRPLTQLFKQTKPMAMSYIRMQAQKKEA
ncbi:MAG: electron transport complex subunit RsxC [Lachnospiraceae bacterium]|nr:electron transport complex subunit RsxC [Lachnospiraceae bacterium]